MANSEIRTVCWPKADGSGYTMLHHVDTKWWPVKARRMALCGATVSEPFEFAEERPASAADRVCRQCQKALQRREVAAEYAKRASWMLEWRSKRRNANGTWKYNRSRMMTYEDAWATFDRLKAQGYQVRVGYVDDLVPGLGGFFIMGHANWIQLRRVKGAKDQWEPDPKAEPDNREDRSRPTRVRSR